MTQQGLGKEFGRTRQFDSTQTQCHTMNSNSEKQTIQTAKTQLRTQKLRKLETNSQLK